ncbi:hypothetical protein PL321_08910 [Caloramator sp. mosi_1]|nr:hypothetical protein [Caloramator sp. mosi_1]WDC85429.1 hypothetical protein PL321_08910 [Caloramator sp. mosi_1]
MNLIGNYLSGKIIKLYGFNTTLSIMGILSFLAFIPALFITSSQRIENNNKKQNKLKITKK